MSTRNWRPYDPSLYIKKKKKAREEGKQPAPARKSRKRKHVCTDTKGKCRSKFLRAEKPERTSSPAPASASSSAAPARPEGMGSTSPIHASGDLESLASLVLMLPRLQRMMPVGPEKHPMLWTVRLDRPVLDAFFERDDAVSFLQSADPIRSDPVNSANAHLAMGYIIASYFDNNDFMKTHRLNRWMSSSMICRYTGSIPSHALYPIMKVSIQFWIDQGKICITMGAQFVIDEHGKNKIDIVTQVNVHPFFDLTQLCATLEAKSTYFTNNKGYTTPVECRYDGCIERSHAGFFHMKIEDEESMASGRILENVLFMFNQSTNKLMKNSFQVECPDMFQWITSAREGVVKTTLPVPVITVEEEEEDDEEENEGDVFMTV